MCPKIRDQTMACRLQSKVYVIQFELLIQKINWKQKRINHVKWFVFLAQIIQLDWVQTK